MIYSTIYKLQDAYRIATADIPGFDYNSPIYNERFDLANRAQYITQANLADAVAEDYIVDTSINLTGGNYSTSTGTYTAATLDISAITMNAVFTSGDVGKKIGFRIGTSTYLARIAQVIGTAEIVIAGNSLPAGNGTVADLIVFASNLPNSSSIDISSIGLLRYGSELAWQIVSDATQSVNMMSRESFERFTPSWYGNVNAIVWCLVGTKILFNQGSNLASLGNITLRAPVLPSVLTADTDYLRMLDGAMCNIFITVYRNLIMRRIPGMNVKADVDELASQIQALFQSRGMQIKEEVVADKVKALISA